ncbi:DUF3291 domain-containing protein [Urechidicola croceus]|uniref:DUF3291 domain-containing protein n=1 Tax=Urechidicola croceus TaxID=1850246 RepID=A0A1D8P5Z0_9FLAO|nr:DUF3291 domain-containing protein [Urechidicola croceus]AOW19957.1 hypothetical protein LPB138_04335 [Urechidicola croceus]
MKYQLAQINIAKLLKPINHPQIADFVNQLDEINALAEKSEGFVWRLKDDNSNDATGLSPFLNPNIIVNMSVWENAEVLKNYVYNSDHSKVFLRRKEWFEKPTKSHMALWWIEEGKFPTVQQAKEKLEYLQKNGNSEVAFTFRDIKNPPKN